MNKHALQSLAILFLLLVPFLAPGVVLFTASGVDHFLEIPKWFDPLFFQFNLLLWMLFVLLVPTITYIYVQSMRDGRISRLKEELGQRTFQARRQYIEEVVARQFSMWNYIASTFTLMLVVAMGLSVLFLLKPVAGDNNGLSDGLNYGKGANLFLFGAYLGRLAPDSHEGFLRIIASLTAFQFGFLGGYIFFIRHLVRSYFTLDLTPHTFVAMSARMVTAGLIALVISFAVPAGLDSPVAEQWSGYLPMLSFGIGFFPDWGLLAITKFTRRVLAIGATPGTEALTPLTELSGVSGEHELRLSRQGYDSLENIAEANLIEMALRTGFSYRQLRSWAGESWLRVALGAESYRQFCQQTGIRTADHFAIVFRTPGQKGEVSLSSTVLAELTPPELALKVRCIAPLVPSWNRGETEDPLPDSDSPTRAGTRTGKAGPEGDDAEQV